MQGQLTRIAADAAWRQQLRVLGLARACEFDWRHTAAGTLGVYARALSRVAAPGRTARGPVPAVRWPHRT